MTNSGNPNRPSGLSGSPLDPHRQPTATPTPKNPTPEGDTEPPGNVYEMLWDCKSCGTQKLLGKTQRFCPNCGSPQDPSWRYFPSDDEKIAVKDHQYYGADQACPSCGTLNAAKAEFCPRCGAPQTDAEVVKVLGSREETTSGQKFEREDLYARQDAEAAAAVSGKPQTHAKPAGGLKPAQIGLIAVIVVVIGGILFTIFSTRETSVYASDFRWERSINIERLSAVPSSSLCSSMPMDAYAVDRRYEQVGSKQVPDGQECRRRQVDQGDGTFREEQVCETKYRSEPVYDYMCYYTLNRWVFNRSADTQGDKQTEPRWAAVNLNACMSLGCEREAGREERYLVILRGDGDATYECPLARDVWDQTRLESRWLLEVGRVLGDARCGSLKPAG